MPTTPHYYTIRAKITGEKTLVRAKNRSQAERGFFARRFAVELTSQQEMVDLFGAGVSTLDLTVPVPKPVPAATTEEIVTAIEAAICEKQTAGQQMGGTT